MGGLVGQGGFVHQYLVAGSNLIHFPLNRLSLGLAADKANQCPNLLIRQPGGTPGGHHCTRSTVLDGIKVVIVIGCEAAGDECRTGRAFAVGAMTTATAISKGCAHFLAAKQSRRYRAAGQHDDHPFHTGVVVASVAEGARLVELVDKVLAAGKLARVEPALAAADGVGYGVVVLPGDGGSSGHDQRVGLKSLADEGDAGLGDASHPGNRLAGGCGEG